jgi:formylglycine-generating enzyme required for sulfatase activity
MRLGSAIYSLTYHATNCNSALAVAFGLMPWVLATVPAMAATPPAWPAASWNPVPLPDDLLLPMPCGGAMAFRAVAVGPAPRALPDGAVVAGALPLGPNGQGAYLLGKYELTRLQAAALRAFAQDSDCPTALDLAQVGPDQALRAAAAEQRLPEARIAWAEARALADDYSAWLRLNAGAYPDCGVRTQAGGGLCISRLAGEPAVARLPTEPEWEYAARGGQAVAATAFADPLPPPLAAAFGRYAWTMDNTRGDPEPIGTRQAGPLGLHDIFGNVSEIQYHGEPGEQGEVFIARGGGYQSQPGQADSRYRDRFRVHDAQGRGRLSETGLRLLIGALIPASPVPSSAPRSWRQSYAFWAVAPVVLVFTLAAFGAYLLVRESRTETTKARKQEAAARDAECEARADQQAARASAQESERLAEIRLHAEQEARRQEQDAIRLAQQAIERLAILWAYVRAEEAAQRPEAQAHGWPDIASPAPREPFSVFRDRLRDGGEGPEMVLLPAGRFVMGSPGSESGRDGDERQHEVQIGNFAIGRAPLTFDEYDDFAAATGWLRPNDRGWGRGRHPVIYVSWIDAMAYAEWLSDQAGRSYRLPTEAEWEYAARAGTQTPFWSGECITTREANYDARSDYNHCGLNTGVYLEKTLPVGSLKPNPWGLYDMLGNVWEWTCSIYDSEYGGAEQRCSMENLVEFRVFRGGSWYHNVRWARCAARLRGRLATRYDDLGIRLALDL